MNVLPGVTRAHTQRHAHVEIGFMSLRHILTLRLHQQEVCPSTRCLCPDWWWQFLDVPEKTARRVLFGINALFQKSEVIKPTQTVTNTLSE